MKLQILKSKLINQLIQQEDTTGSFTITIDDHGKKEFTIEDRKGEKVTIKGTYHLSNLLQEVALLSYEKGTLHLKNITEKPTNRISRVIKQYYWQMLTRNIDENNLLSILEDEKMQGDFLRLYVPETDTDAQSFYKDLVKSNDKVKVEIVPEKISDSFIKKIEMNPGILTLSYSKKANITAPYVVPGGRFNEMYGWDSYFISRGLIIDDEFDLAKSMIENLEYQIIHYGKILNANRSYFLTRSQPPFFTSFLIKLFEKFSKRLTKDWLAGKLKTAIIEYRSVWMCTSVRLTSNGLNRYFGEGKGIPPETEKGHFEYELKRFAQKHGLELEDFEAKYKNGEIQDTDLNDFFVHDRSMRESGHDTTSRLNDVSAHLNPICLNSLLYKYETDISYIIKNYFEDNFEDHNSQYWNQKAEERKSKMNQLLWDEEKLTFYDYNFVKNEQHKHISATNFYPLWVKLCTQEQAQKIVDSQLKHLKYNGGIVSTSKEVAILEENQPGRQWDFPYGWAPHQMIIWEGLINYGFDKIAQELIYRWLWLIVKTVVNYNGLIPEKFDVVNCTHKVNVEYGNVGTDFKYVPDGGFGWTNASYKLGMSLLDSKYIPSLNKLIEPDKLF